MLPVTDGTEVGQADTVEILSFPGTEFKVPLANPGQDTSMLEVPGKVASSPEPLRVFVQTHITCKLSGAALPRPVEGR